MASKYRHVLKAVYGNQWAILPEKMEQITELLQLRAQGVTLTREQIADRVGLFDAPKNHSTPQIAVLNLFGTISHRMNAFSSFSGGTSTEQFQQAFLEARDNSNVVAIVINADTPGGSVPGVPELSDLIYESRGIKPIKTVVNPMMASAGVWIGTAADEVIAIPSASDIGSIGVLTMHTEHSKADESDGYKTTIIQSVNFKAEGNSYEPLSEAALEHFQSRVMSIHHEFVDAVARNRDVTAQKVESDFGRGRTMRAQEALQAGLVDRIATLDQVIKELGEQAGSTSGVAAVQSPSSLTLEIEKMDSKLKAALVKAGLCKVSDDENTFEQALSLHCEAEGVNASDAAAVLESFAPTTQLVASTLSTGVVETTTTQTSSVSGMSQEDLLATIRVSAVPKEQQMDLLTALTPELATLSQSQILDRIDAEIQKHQATPGYEAPRVTTDSQDKLHDSARDAILMREMGSNAPNQIYDYKSGEYIDFKPGRQQYGLQSLPKLAERCLVQAGVPYERVASLAPMHVAQLMMGANPASMGLGGILASSNGPAYNVSGMFSNILLDAANVMLRRSYDDARTTFQLWMRQAASISDFKLVNKVIAGELGDPQAVPEDGEFEETTLSDGKESYKLTVWGSIFSHSWQLIVNDQLSSFTEIPAKMGRSMRRKQNRLAYGVVNDNAALSDNVALFHSSHSNRSTGANADAAAIKAKWVTLEKRMAEQTGLDADSGALNLEPRWVVAPPALRDTIQTALNSTSLSTGNPGITNTFQGKYELVTDAQMGAAQGGSDTRYVLAADHGDVDTIEYAYLQGLEAPVIEQEVSFTSLGMKRRIYQAFASKAIDYRGLQDDTGV